MQGLNSDLNLNVGASPRVMPGIGEWGPTGVPSTRSKKRMRWIVVGLFLLALVVLVGYGWLMLGLLR
ncbi:MAG: hypothetical protein LBR32_10225 [Propionibacteriaceae bacterium]|jgi:hypothetical protein|nr:hypothetical protein [Propionibacteriaceae bacterium]